MSNDIQWEDAPEVKWEDAPNEGIGSKLTDAAKSAVLQRVGMGEAAANFVTGMPAALGGGLAYLGGLATGDTDAAMAIKQGVEKRINGTLQYDPRTAAGKRYSENLNKGFQNVVEAGGPAFENTIKSIPFVGEDLANNHEAMDAIGKAYTEMALNVAPIEGVHGMLKRKGKPEALSGSSNILENLEPPKPVEPVWESAPVSPDVGTAAHADDFATINPYDAGGHVTEAQAGRPSTIDNAQGDLFGGRTLEDAQAAPKDTPVADEMIRRDRVDEDIANWEPEKKYDTLPKTGTMQEAFDRANRDKAFNDMDAHKQAQIDAAYEMQELAKQRDFNKMEAQKELDFADSASKIENSPTRGFFLDPKNMDKVDFHSTPNMATLKSGEQIHLETHDTWNGDPNQGAIIARDIHGNEVGFMAFAKVEEGGVRHNPHVEVEPHMQRKGVATAMYNLAEKAGAKIPHVDQVGQVRTAAGQAFRSAYDQRAHVTDHQFAHEALGDKSLMDHEPTGNMVEALHRGDVNAALDVISKGHDNVAYRNLAEYLKGKLDGIKVQVHDEGVLTLGDRHATGYYDPTTRTVGFSKVGAVSPHTVLHELVHAMTSDFVNLRPNDLRVMGLKDLFSKLNDLGMQKEFPQIVNVKEFLAEAFSNPEFQQFLKEHQLQNRSTWRRFVDNVKSILGLSRDARNHITDALEHTLDLGKQVMEAKPDTGGMQAFKDAGVPSNLADLMVSRKKRPEPVNTKSFEDVQRLKVPGLTGPVSDFTFYDKPIGEIIEMAKQADDIPNTMLERLSHQLQAGGLFESLKTRNPVVKQTFERIYRASQEAERNIKETLTHPETGLVPKMRALSLREKGEAWAVAMKYEGDRVLSGDELRQAGMNEKQVSYYLKERELNERMFKEINEARAQIGLRPMDHRVAHIAGRFTGDFSRFVFGPERDELGNPITDTNGIVKMKIVGRVAGNTKWELNKISKFIEEKHPEFSLGKHEYNTLGRSKKPADRFNGLVEAINFLTKTDSDAASLFESYRDYMQRDAVNYLNATRSAKAKVKDSGGIIGSEGHKEWESLEQNAEQGMKAQVAYFEQSYKWIAMEKAVNDLKPLLGDEDVARQTPNAMEWAEQYKAHALGIQNHPIANLGNWTISKIGELTGVGHSNIFKYTNLVKHFTMQKFMGFGNIPFSITQLMQPLQVHPAMLTLLKNRGLEFSARSAQVKATQTYFNALTGQKMGKLSDFEKSALDYAEKTGIMDVKMADHTRDVNESPFMDKYHKVADFNITVPERLTRGTSFLFYSHILKDAGIPDKDIFGAAENMTNMTMVNYHPLERPMGYAKLGWLGDLASTLTRYKHNQGSQMAFYAREGIMHGNYKPMSAFLATSIAFGGVMGFFGFNEADEAYQWITKHLGKPDSLTAQVLGSGMPEVLSHGVFSTLGLDMTSRFSNANLLPNSAGQGLIPFGSAVWDMTAATGRWAVDPLNTYKLKQMAKAYAPQSVQGIMENTMFTEKQPDGTNLYTNSTDGPNLGKGRVARSDGDMMLRNFGFRDIRESKELAKNYSNSQISKAHKDIADGIVMKAKYEALNGSLDQAKAQELAQKAAKYGMSPDEFVGKMVSWQQDRHLTQAQQQRLHDALGGFRGAVNISEGR